MLVEATAPGKMILFGEHSVVYGRPAIVLAIDRRARVIAKKRDDKKIYIDADNLGFSGYFEDDVYHAIRGKAWRGRNLAGLNVAAKKTMETLGYDSGVNLKVRSMIPIAVGLGSSAAICVATVGAVQQLFDADLSQQEISDIAYEGEKVIHGSPSGVDNNISANGGILRYSKEEGFQKYESDIDIPFLIGNSRKKRSTRIMVENVAELKKNNPELMETVLDSMGQVAEEGLQSLLMKDTKKLGDLMNINHGLLSAIGVSTMKLDILVHTARKYGAYGAKLTGAGGGGCMIAIGEENNLVRMEKSLRRRKSDTYRVSLTDRGVESRWIEEHEAS
ncbi:mevalonate kinase [Candidatus Bathyarchaeota archaeon]|jgi:mevalonate kinase|nr:mevalonate kinase [Candidatus Bathyarchaeota archaeon]